MTLSKTSRAIPLKTTTAAEAHRQSVLAKKNVLVAAENDAHRHGLGATAAKQASAEVRRKAHLEEFSGRHNKMQMDLQEAVAMSAEAATKSPKPIAAETAAATRRAMPGGMVSTMVFKIEGDIKKAKPRTPWLAKQG